MLGRIVQPNFGSTQARVWSEHGNVSTKRRLCGQRWNTTARLRRWRQVRGKAFGRRRVRSRPLPRPRRGELLESVTRGMVASVACGGATWRGSSVVQEGGKGSATVPGRRRDPGCMRRDGCTRVRYIGRLQGARQKVIATLAGARPRWWRCEGVQRDWGGVLGDGVQQGEVACVCL